MENTEADTIGGWVKTLTDQAGTSVYAAYDQDGEYIGKVVAHSYTTAGQRADLKFRTKWATLEEVQ